MGFFSNLKNSLTGSWADVSVSAPAAARGQSVPLTVRVTVKDAAIEFDRVVVEVTCNEIVEIDNYRTTTGGEAPAGTTPTGSSSSGGSGTVNVRTSESLFTQKVEIAGAQKLDAGVQQTFEGTVALPAHLPPAMRGRHARYEWMVRASLEMRGNDPDSGWQPLEVR